MYFLIFGSITAVLGAFDNSIANLCKICNICICRTLAEVLPDYLEPFFKRMFDNGYMYPKHIFPVTYVV
jgi:hypothetical protein